MSKKAIRADDLGEILHPHTESRKQKFLRKVRSNPLVPLGCGLTVAALFYGLYQFALGNSKKSNLMMRARVAAQGFTILVLVGGVLLSRNATGDKSK